jgi:hypothetical protein
MQNEGEMRPGVFGRFSNDSRLQELQSKAANRGHDAWDNAIALHYKFTFEPGWWLNFRDLLIDRTKRRTSVVNECCAKDLVAHFKADSTCVVREHDEYSDLVQSQGTLHNMLSYGLVILACGPCANVICYRLYKLGYEGIALDVGSIADCLAGVHSRAWIREEGDKCRGRYL